MKYARDSKMLLLLGGGMLALTVGTAVASEDVGSQQVDQEVETLEELPREFDTKNVFSLHKHELVCLDNPALKIQPDLSLIVDEPPVIDKRDFRVLQSDDYSPGIVVVQFKPGTTEEAKQAAHAEAGGTTVTWTASIVPHLYLVETVLDVPATINRYLDNDDVLYAEPQYIEKRQVTNPNDSFFDDLWGMKTGAGATLANHGWSEHWGDQEFVIAVIDDGVDFNHEDLASNIWTNDDEIPNNGFDDDQNGFVDDTHGWDFGEGDNNVLPSSIEAHGTHVAGTVGARGNNATGVVGVSWRCRIMITKHTQASDPDQNYLSTTAGLNYAVANGATVSNNSYGGRSFSQSAYNAILASQALGHVFVTSAGNDFVDTDTNPQYPCAYDLANIVSVASLDSQGNLSGFSNYGDVTVDLAAPGSQVLSTLPNNQYGNNWGTSMAAPHVAGAIGVVRSKYPELTWQQVKELVISSATKFPMGGLAGETVSGGKLVMPTMLGIWVNPNAGSNGQGLKDIPYRASQFGQAYSHTPDHGRLNIQSGNISTGNLPGTFDKPMTLQAAGGAVTLGS